MILLHGRGADETDLADLAYRFPERFDYASVRAPVPVEGGGFTWFENRGPARPITASLRASVASFRQWIDGPDAAPKRDSIYLLGFSAGMMMASALLLDDPKRFAGAVLLSGAMPLDAMAQDAVDGRLAGIPIFYAHGSADDVIPAALVQRTQTYLRDRSGANLTSRTYAHGHEISHREVADIAAWFASSPGPNCAASGSS